MGHARHVKVVTMVMYVIRYVKDIALKTNVYDLLIQQSALSVVRMVTTEPVVTNCVLRTAWIKFARGLEANVSTV